MKYLKIYKNFESKEVDINSFQNKKLTFYFSLGIEDLNYPHIKLEKKEHTIPESLSLGYLHYMEDTDSFQFKNSTLYKSEDRLFSVDEDTAEILTQFAKTINPETEITPTNIKINNYKDLEDKLVSGVDGKTRSQTLPVEDIDYSVGSDGTGDGKEYEVNIRGKEHKSTIGISDARFNVKR